MPFFDQRFRVGEALQRVITHAVRRMPIHQHLAGHQAQARFFAPRRISASTDCPHAMLAKVKRRSDNRFAAVLL